MNRVHAQLRSWWFLEAGTQFCWGLARCLAVALVVLGLACLADWIYDRYTDTPYWMRVLMLGGQIALAVGLVYAFILRPMRRVPGYDDLALRAERAIPAFDHRLVTALQLNRPGARTSGMSRMLIAEVTQEAGEIASHHRLTKLANFRPLLWAAAVLLPVLLAAGIVTALNTPLVTVLLKRQALLDVEIPRSVAMKNVTPEVWPTGSEGVIRIRVTGEWNQDMVGTVHVLPDGQIEDHYPLKFETTDSDGSAIFAAKLPPSSTRFTFRARLADGRLKQPGDVDFEAPPQIKELDSWQLLPSYLGQQPDGSSFERQDDGGIRGNVIEALPLSGIRILGRFTKPIREALLYPIELDAANKEVDGSPVRPGVVSEDRLAAVWTFPTTPETIGYRIALTDDRGFHNPEEIRRTIQMRADQPPEVERMRESTRNPDPTDYYGGGDPYLYEYDIPLSPGGRVMVIYYADSPLGIGQVNLAYRVIPKGTEADNLHPRDDPNWRTFTRSVLYTWDKKNSTPKPVDPALGRFVEDLGLFEKSFAGKTAWYEQEKIRVPCHLIPSEDPATEPGELAAGGRTYLNTGDTQDTNQGGLIKPDGTKIIPQVGDTLEIYIEVIDKYDMIRKAEAEKNKDSRFVPRTPGYPREAIRKPVVSPGEAWLLTHQKKITQMKLKNDVGALSTDQGNIFNPPEPKKKP